MLANYANVIYAEHSGASAEPSPLHSLNASPVGSHPDDEAFCIPRLPGPDVTTSALPPSRPASRADTSGGVVADDSMLDEPVTIRQMLVLVHLVRDTKPRDGLRALEDALIDLAARAGSVPAGVVQIP